MNRAREKEPSGRKNDPMRQVVVPAGSSRIMDERPKLVVGNSDQGEPVYYVCSRCFQGFPFPDIQPPREAVRELFQRFRKHLDQEHPDPAANSLATSAAHDPITRDSFSFRRGMPLETRRENESTGK